jgi:circadian clock protein KaiC
MKHVQAGIEGLDIMLNGGLPSGRCILVCGGPGSGKTVASMQFLCHGAETCNENGLFISLDESIAHIREEMENFGMNIGKLEKSGKLKLVDASPVRHLPGEIKIGDLWVGKRDFSFISLMGVIREEAQKINARRLVIDPITALMFQYSDPAERRTAVLDLFEALANLKATSLITSELRDVTLERRVRPEEFLAHGVIVFNVFVHRGEMVRGVQIEKMRGMAHDTQVRLYKITGNGVEVFPQEEPLVEARQLVSAPRQ